LPLPTAARGAYNVRLFASMPDKPDPQHWRGRALKARAKAGQMKEPLAKCRLLGLADFYERLAKQQVENSWSRRRLPKKSS
jgi:hypothetical protein